MKSLIRIVAIGGCVALAGSCPGVAGYAHADNNVSLSWNRNAEADLSGYRVYYGVNSGEYDHVEEAYLDTFITVGGLDSVAYYFVVTAYDTAGNESAASEEVSWTPGGALKVTGNDHDGIHLPRSYRLAQNYPNPFNPMTTIRYMIADKPGHGPTYTSLRIYTLRGMIVKTLVEEEKTPGEYLVQWDGRSDRGEEMASGTYFCHLQAGEYSSTRKMVMQK